MRLEDIKDYMKDKEFLEYPDLENMFNVYMKDGSYVLNLNSTMYVNVPESALKYHVINHDMFWPTISYQIYGTTRYAWLLMKLNTIKAKNMFKKVLAGTTIKCVERSVLDTITTELRKKD